MVRFLTDVAASTVGVRRIVLACAALVAACGGGDRAPDGTSVGAAEQFERPLAIAAPSAGTWSSRISVPTLPAAAAHLPSGKILFWSAGNRLSFSTTGFGRTYTSIFNPATRTSTDTLVSQTGHEMFCPGTSNLADGTLLVNGGSDSAETSLYQPATNSWSVGATMQIPRGYQANTVLQDGSVLTLGGSWSGGLGGKHAEIWRQASGWSRLSGVTVDPALGNDRQGIYRSDNHMWLFAAPNGRVFHAGPSNAMNWIDTRGNGSIVSAGTRGSDPYSQGGTAVMYDVGKILKIGGAPSYSNAAATSRSYVIDINRNGSARRVAPMAYARTFANAVVLPNGQVVVIGGQTFSKLFSDDNAVLAPELWDPKTETFTPLRPIAVARNYHSVALLLPDGRVMSGGGGLCGTSCATNHADVQILTPHYLLNADGTLATRPAITSAPTQATHGTTITVKTNVSVTAFALIRMSSVTHSVNNDQRRIPLAFTVPGTNTYALKLPSNPGIVLPGYYMLFALNSSGVPSVSRPVQITGHAAPKLVSPGPQSSAAGSSVTLALSASTPSGTLAFSASGMPPGLTINASTGVISGVPTTAGVYVTVASAANNIAKTSTNIIWTIT